MHWVTIIGIALIALGTLLTYLGQDINTRRDTAKLINQNKELLAKVDKYQEDLNQKEKKIQELEESHKKLEEQTAPRVLTIQKQNKLTEMLSFKSGFQIGIACRAFDQESYKYAEQLTEIFRNANWQVATINRSYLDDTKSDIAIVVTDNNQLETANKIIAILNNAGVNCQSEQIRRDAISGIKQNTIYLIIGSKK